MFNLKLYRQGTEVLVAISDHDLVGQEFRDGNLQLVVDESFYGSDVTDEHTVTQHLRIATIGNLVGAGIVALAVRAGYVDEANVLTIAGVPHAQFAVDQRVG